MKKTLSIISTLAIVCSFFLLTGCNNPFADNTDKLAKAITDGIISADKVAAKIAADKPLASADPNCCDTDKIVAAIKTIPVPNIIVEAPPAPFTEAIIESDLFFVPNFPGPDEHMLLKWSGEVRSDEDGVVPVVVKQDHSVFIERKNRDHLILISRKLNGKFNRLHSGDPLKQARRVEISAISIPNLLTAPKAEVTFYIEGHRFNKEVYPADFKNMDWIPADGGCNDQIIKALTGCSGLLPGEAKLATPYLRFK